MALVVNFSPDASGFASQKRVEYHMPFLWKDVVGMSALSQFVTSVYADGHEHELVLQRFCHAWCFHQAQVSKITNLQNSLRYDKN